MNYQWLAALGIAITAISCAQIRAVEGGAKDIKPPTLLAESVADGQTQWRGQELFYEFDEYIQLQDVQNQVIISPSIQPAPTILAKGKKLFIRWETPLKENTTYTFQWGNAITDITENNAASLERVFSTGEVLDSLQLQFSVYDAWNKKGMDNAVVALLTQPFHPDSNNMAAYQKKAIQGRCSFQHLPGQSFYVMGFQDNNKDGRYTPGEWMDWIDLPLLPKSRPDTLMLSLAPVEQNFNSLLSTHTDSIGHVKWFWPVEEIPKVVTKDNIKGSFYLQKDTAHYYLMGIPDNKIHTLYIEWGKGEQDSLDVPFFKSSIENFSLAATSIDPVVLPIEIPRLTSALPIDSVRLDKLLWSYGKQNTKLTTRYEWPFCYITPVEVKKEEYTLTLLPECFVTHQINWPSDTLIIKGKIQGTEDRGEIEWNIQTPGRIGYWALTGERDEQIWDFTETPKKMLLKPGKYQFRWVEDLNQNKRWDPSNYQQNQHAERVEMYPKTIEVRANWTQIINWNIP